MENLELLKNENPHKNRVHKVLAHSYIFHFISFLTGLIFDFLFPLKIFEKFTIGPLGLLFLVVGTFLILWAQKTSHKLNKENISKETFSQGPYRYMRSPTNLGLFLSTLGFGLIINSLFIAFFSVFSFIISKFVFIRKEEEILTQKYGTPYLEYKKSIKF